jgi:hypothetical protein
MNAPTTLAAVALAAVLAPAPAALARIGEPLADCVKRYGPVRATLPAVVAESDPEAARFEYGALSVIVHFQKGMAWHISYAQAYLSDPDRRRLLGENVLSGEWEPHNGALTGNVYLWHHRTAGLVACGINSKSLNTLEVMTRPCAEAFGRARAQRIAQAMAGQPSIRMKPADTGEATATPGSDADETSR